MKRMKLVLINNEEGMVLIMVLIVLVATIIIGVTMMRTTTIDTKIAGNERQNTNDFYLAEGALEFAFQDCERYTTMGENVTYNYTASPSGVVPNQLNGINKMTAKRLYNQAVPFAEDGQYVFSQGGKAQMTAMHYHIETSKNNEEIHCNMMKVVPMGSIVED